MQIYNTSASFTRPNDTTAYATNDLVANSTTAGSVVPLTIPLGNAFGQGQFRMTRIRLSKSTTGVGNSTFRVHFYSLSPTCANGDNAAWSTNISGWLGSIDTPAMNAFTDGAAATGAAVAGSEMMIRLSAGTTVYCLLMALGAYAPGALEVFTLTFEELQSY